MYIVPFPLHAHYPPHRPRSSERIIEHRLLQPETHYLRVLYSTHTGTPLSSDTSTMTRINQRHAYTLTHATNPSTISSHQADTTYFSRDGERLATPETYLSTSIAPYSRNKIHLNKPYPHPTFIIFSSREISQT